ncbi:AraC family transcriptional regulator [Nocardia asteroides]|uniref:AraC family transcriptional regulator n=1 Tax=Nocardia asteroides TaxID=1824 RepID=UPI001E62BA81|nr:AraC family transcriptional regulator [Nocardia asteroides]UGT62650.1 helix-turn-helix transcriptional regulator [Nocardia asteroides]
MAVIAGSPAALARPSPRARAPHLGIRVPAASATAEPVRGCPGLAAHVTVSATHRGRGDTTAEHHGLGDGAWLTRLRYAGLAAGSPREHPSDPSSRIISIAVLAPGEWALTSRGTAVSADPEQATLIALDQSAPFDFRGHGSGSAVAVHIGHARLTLSIETVHRGLDHLHPGLALYPLVRNHIEQLGAVAAGAPGLLPALGATTIALVRSLLISAADVAQGELPGRTPIAAIERYIADHLDEPGLGAERIAAAHSISARQLYKIWPAANGPLAGYITARRLERARITLRTQPHLSIAAVARRHGFAHPTHFSHRFRAAFGCSPSVWRRIDRYPADA